MINDDAKKCYYFAVKSKLESCSFKWLKNKKNWKNRDSNNFQNNLNDALNYYSIETNLERISNIEPFIKQYNWKETTFPSHQMHWKNF